MRHRTGLRAAAVLCGIAVAGAACAGDESAGTNPPNAPDATFATVPEISPTPDDALATPDTAQDTTATTVAPQPPTTVPLVASGSADLPTGSPEELAAPTTTIVTGPLPVPGVQLAEYGQFNAPIEIATRSGDVRSFVVEQGGVIRATDELSDETVLDISDITSVDGEQGLLGAAFHPTLDFAYVNYSDAGGNTVVAEFEFDPVTAVFDRESRREVLTVEQPFGNHNGGELAFGFDGYLYIGFGDGGSADDPQRNSLALSTRLGKILRIDPLAAGDDAFTVPGDNPFANTDGADPTIWSLGLRNPWRFSFDSATGDLWIADVGQNEFEEINFAPAIDRQGAGKGLSFGWSAFEGDAPFNPDQPTDGHTPPVLTYSHSEGDCSVSGGAVYRGQAIPDLVGWYVYGDFCSGQIWGYDPTSASRSAQPVIVELAQLGSLAAIAVGGDGELYAVSNAGTISRFDPA